MHAIHIVLIIALCKLTVSVRDSLNPLSDDFIELINKEGKWKAGKNFPSDTPMEHIRGLMGSNMESLDWKKLPVFKHDSSLKDNLPESFDLRKKWPNCPTLNEIRDQGRCGACWAFGAVEAMTDRVCIKSNGTKQFHFSAEDLVTCISKGNDCDGGNSFEAWLEWAEVGLVSGGNYNSHEGCKPYSFPPCANHLKNCTDFKPTPPCVQTCVDGFKSPYEQNKKHGKNIIAIQGEEDIMAELYNNGPVEASFLVYEDFADYKGGVYEHLKGELIFGHAVKMIGWGVENDKKYWLIANSWGTGFGENGFFKILRGKNECYIESYVVTGEPVLEEY